MQFKKAEKNTSLLRCAVHGPTGSGKTFTALRMATGMNSRLKGKIALIDTERGRAKKYGDRFEFDVLDLPKNNIETYTEAIQVAAKHRYDILIIDSLTHAWQELLEEVDRIAATKYRGNSFSAWSEGTPKQNQFVEAILSFPGHMIVTMRSKMEYSLEKMDNGKMRPIKVGLQPQQGKNIEYEFDLLLEMNLDHTGIISKDITGKFQDKIIEKPGEEFGVELIDWLNEGKRVHPNQKFIDSVLALGVDPKVIIEQIKPHGHDSLETIFDRETQLIVYKTIKAIKNNFPVAPVLVVAPQAQAGSFTPSSPPGPAPVMDQNTINFLNTMGGFKKEIAEKTGDESLYYNTLGSNGFTHANEVNDPKNMDIVYYAMEAVVKELRDKPGAQNA